MFFDSVTSVKKDATLKQIGNIARLLTFDEDSTTGLTNEFSSKPEIDFGEELPPKTPLRKETDFWSGEKKMKPSWLLYWAMKLGITWSAIP